jgi:16S rRNA (guanine966-N2)-methyltransferase
MRVIAGSAKGLKLTVPEGDAVRPTADRVREALMSALGGFFDGEEVLDLCAGSGAVGIELLSRGCGKAHFIEPGEQAAAALADNITRSQLHPRATVLRTDAARAITVLQAAEQSFDFIYVDPPWEEDMHAELVHAIATAGLLRAGGELIVERDRRSSTPSPVLEGWELIWQRNYGRTVIERLGLVSQP